MATAIVQVWGGGGSASNNSGGDQIATGGGGGAFSQLNAFAITSGTGYTVTIGLGGIAVGVDVNGNPGGDSWFSTSGTVLAKAGTGGLLGGISPTSGGTGGLASSGIGDVKHSGGNGGSATSAGSLRTGGGGGAGSGGDGGNVSLNDITGGTGGTPDGGAGGTSSSGVTVGHFPSGGGGAFVSAGNGAGANGQVIITAPTSLGISATGGTHTQSGGNDIWTFTSSGTWTPTIPASVNSGFFMAAASQ